LDPRPTLELVALGHMEVTPQQMKALTALLPYVHKKLGEGGKKEQAAERAGVAAKRFGARPAPLKLVGGG
jgi:phage terminase small subunit